MGAGTLDNYIQTFQIGKTPIHKARTSADDRVAILFCEIRVWAAKCPDWWNCNDYLRITEVESVEVEKSYKKLISKARITLPRGSMLSQRIKKNDGLRTGNGTKSKEETTVKEATQNGDVLVPGSSQYTDGTNTLSINATRCDDGIIKVESKDTTGLMKPGDVAVGNRIEIYLGYAYDEETYRRMMDKNDNLTGDLVFTGLISKCSVNTPINIDCEDMASILKKFQCPNVVAKKNYTVNDYLKPGGTFNLLKGTGIQLDPETQELTINVGKVNMTRHNVVADVLDEWSKCGIFVFMTEGKHPKLRVGRTYTSSLEYGKDGNLTKSNGSANIIQFDWDVASDNLKVLNVDKNFIAVEAHGMDKNGKFFKFTLRENPNGAYQVINQRRAASRKTLKKADGTTSGRGMIIESEPTVDMSNYTVVTFFAPKVGCTFEELKNLAINYKKQYSPNGVSGTVTLFGDRVIRPTDTVGIIDPRHPERNGYYFVESVNIKFGVSEGYRKEIKLPYRVGKFGGPVKIENI